MMRREQLFVFAVTVCIAFISGITEAAPPKWVEDVLATRTVCENAAAGEVVYTMEATPGDASDSVEYLLGNEASIDFEMCDGDSNSANTDGRVCAKKDLDRETLSLYSVTEQARKKGSSNSADMISRNVIVTITDVNDNYPIFEGLPYSFNVPEGKPMGTAIGEISAYDNDDSFAASVIFSISDEKGILALESTTTPTNVTITRILDFEESPNFIGTITAKDEGDYSVRCGPTISLSSEARVYLNVDDGPDNKPTFTLPQYSANLQENANELDGVLMIEARDGDFGLNWNVAYSLEDDLGIFEIDEDSGNLTVLSTASVDRESNELADGYYTLSVKATEIMPVGFDMDAFVGFPGAQSSSVVATIYVTDANDNLPLFYSDPDYKDVSDSYNINVSESNVGPVPNFLIYIKDADQPSNAIFNLNLIGDDSIYFELSQASDLQSQASLSLLVKDLDFETKQTLTFQIEAFEPDKTGVTTVTVTVNVLDENDNKPVFKIPDDHVYIDEDIAINSTVKFIVATDADSGEFGEIEFSLQPDNSGFSIDKTTGEVITDSVLDREIRVDYYLTILATDGGGLVTTTQFTVTLLDVNDNNPEFQQSQYTVNWNEDASNPEAIQVVAFDRDDPKSNNSKMEIFFDDAFISDQFIISETVTDAAIEGSIVPRNPLDAEALTEDCENGVIQFQFPVYVRDLGTPQRNGSAEVTVFFRDINDHTPKFNASVYLGSVPEESDANTDIVTVFATDDDKCLTNNDMTFLVDNEFADKFLMGPSENGASSLKVRGSLDRDVKDSYDVIVYAVDSGQPRMTGNATIKVTITDINNKIPIFNSSNMDNAKVIETAAVGTEVASLFASDDDLDSLLNFMITSSRCIDENGAAVSSLICSNWFDITSMNEEGAIRVASELDRETVATVVLTVQVEDQNAATTVVQTSQTTFTVTIEDYNDNDPVIEEPAEAFEVLEESFDKTVIGRLSATDDDENNEIVFSVSSPYVDISKDGELYVQGNIDREGDPGNNFSAVIVATDNDISSGISRSSNITVYFDVIDTNDHTPAFQYSNFTCTIKENQPQDTHVCTILATDDDIGINAEIVYSLPGVTQFVINSTTGEIWSNQEFDQEFRNLYQFKMRAQDSARDPRYAEVDVTINIIDLDDNAPTYDGNQDDQTLSFEEENSPDTLIGKVRKATDADTEENQQNYYFLINIDGVDLSDKFSLNKTSRELYAKTTLDREMNDSYTLTVLTTQSESITSVNITEEAHALLTVNIAIGDINDNAPSFPRKSDTTDLLYSTTYGENNVVAVLTATDPDAGLNSSLKYEILTETYEPPEGATPPQNNGSFFVIDPTNGQVKTTSRSFEGSVSVGGLFRLEIKVTDRDGDSEGRSDEMTLDIKIFDETETVILKSRFTEDYLETNRAELESDLEAALDADVVIDKIIPQETSGGTPAARVTSQDTQILTEIHFHATEWTETTLIPADEIAAELDSSTNNELLIKWAIVSISTSNADTGEPVSPTDLLKTILAVVSAVLILFLVVLMIAFICMRRSYKRKLRVQRATEEGNRSIDQLTGNDNLKIPNTNINAGMESKLYLEDQKEAINLAYLHESTDDNNSIDDNAVDSQDSAFSGDRQGSFKEDDFDDVDIDYPNEDLANLQNVLNRKGGGNMVFDSTFDSNTAM